ncbi:hypothetical protein QP162_19210 [Sphingomonas aurantiaca]|uniref:hypothetical protein n=1 Tax=Sphingomonas aurantiaca TaxID=185949 RepID=UPI002FE428AC
MSMISAMSSILRSRNVFHVGVWRVSVHRENPTSLDRFMSDEGFEVAMASFMMQTLDLDPITAMQGKEGERQIVEHGWAALSGGLYFGGDHKQLLGDVQMAGLPARMLQMYIGMP